MAAAGRMRPSLNTVARGGREWDWFWKNCSYSSPLFPGEYSHAPSLTPNKFEQPNNRVGDRGRGALGHAFVTDATGEYVSYAAGPRVVLTDPRFSLFCAVDITGTVGSAPGIQCHRDTGGADGEWIFYKSGNLVVWAHYSGGLAGTVNWGAVWPGNGFHTFAFTRVGSAHKLWIDAKYKGSQGSSYGANATQRDYCVGALATNATGHVVNGRWYCAYVFQHYELTTQNILALNADPFGPYRESQILSGGAVGFTAELTAGAYLYSAQNVNLNEEFLAELTTPTYQHSPQSLTALFDFIAELTAGSYRYTGQALTATFGAVSYYTRKIMQAAKLKVAAITKAITRAREDN